MRRTPVGRAALSIALEGELDEAKRALSETKATRSDGQTNLPSCRLVVGALCFLLTPALAHAADPDRSRGLARGPLYAGLTAFVGGLLVCLTPCVYPMIAITVSVFGARQSQSRMHAMGLSTAFVLGIAAMFTPLGVAAGLTGQPLRLGALEPLGARVHRGRLPRARRVDVRRIRVRAPLLAQPTVSPSSAASATAARSFWAW